ncbi:helix-turn-helix domain-containing protein [Candidatus Regiella insecticola]|uniref:helix-turn-helix domain-containing protein n=1 Tax=Candidatus Regiella insecticola TaxID=138073 RepID=UPI0002E5B5E9|nr:helix-turn-helix domain-containing protein [Candidatus Regiella insecticola]
MIIPEQRQSIMMWITESTQAGARQQQACLLIGLSTRTLQRWQKAIEQVDGRTRRTAPPPHKLSPCERAKLLEITSSAKFAHLPPSQIVPMLADEGLYFASESTFKTPAHGSNTWCTGIIKSIATVPLNLSHLHKDMQALIKPY